jgi:hypothetical protein
MKNLIFILAISFATLVSCTKETITPNLNKGAQSGAFVELVFSNNVTDADTMSVAVTSPVNDTLKVYTSVGSQVIKIDFGSFTTFYGCTVQIALAVPNGAQYVANDIKYSKTILPTTQGFTANVNFSTWVHGVYLVRVLDSNGTELSRNLIKKVKFQ